MAVFVAGATGFLGGHVTRLLVERGEHVRAFVRSVEDDAPVRALGAEVITGNFEDPDSLRGAAAGLTGGGSTAGGGCSPNSLASCDQSAAAFGAAGFLAAGAAGRAAGGGVAGFCASASSFTSAPNEDANEFQ